MECRKITCRIIEVAIYCPDIIYRAVRNPNFGAEDIAEILERDPAMCAKNLQIVNSAYFGLPQHIVSIAKAVTYLGVDLIKGLTLATHVFAPTQPAAADASPTIN